MKKSVFTYFIPVFLILLLVCFFACDYNFQWPKEIEIKIETPELSFNANTEDFEFATLFGDLDKFDVGAGDAKLLKCTNTPILTYVIYIELYNGSIGSVLPDYFDFFAGLGVTDFETTEDQLLLWAEESIDIEPPVLTGTPLESFSLKPLTSRAYISGANPDFVDVLKVELFTGTETHLFGRSQSSNISKDATEYHGTSLPPSKNEFQVVFDEDLIVNFNVTLMGGETIYTEWLDNLNVKLELAIWFACEFVAGPGGAEIELPFTDMMMGGGDSDLFGRESADDESFTEMIENITLGIQLSTNPFPNAVFVVENPPDMHLESSITGRILGISIDKEDLVYPFKPEFFIKFEEGDEIIVPRVFSLEKLGFKAKLRYVVDAPKFEFPIKVRPEPWF